MEKVEGSKASFRTENRTGLLGRPLDGVLTVSGIKLQLLNGRFSWVFSCVLIFLMFWSWLRLDELK